MHSYKSVSSRLCSKSEAYASDLEQSVEDIFPELETYEVFII